MEYVYSRHFPDDFMGNLLVANVITVQGILRYKIEPNGSSLKGTELEPIVTSTDPNFRPSDVKVAPDGSICFSIAKPDHRPLAARPADPSRDATHGRIYRITYENRPLLSRNRLPAYRSSNCWTCSRSRKPIPVRARFELGGRDSAAVIAAVNKWVAGLDKKDPNYEHNVLEALWLHQYHNVVDVDLLQRVLASPDSHARAPPRAFSATGAIVCRDRWRC